ncbi:MAG TPA: hypothetical protein DCP36_00315 [Sporomusaceae bacterium]|nr:hypothetical protein [Sporomusaceae bacterium]
MMRTVPVMLMPALYQVKKKPARGYFGIPLLLLVLFVIWAGVISSSVIAGEPITDQSLNTIQMLEEQYDAFATTVSIILKVDHHIDVSLGNSYLIIGLVIAVGCFIGFWAGLYDRVSSSHYYIIDIRRKR